MMNELKDNKKLSPTAEIVEKQKNHFLQAFSEGLPNFLHDIPDSHAGNSSPYITDIIGLKDMFSTDVHRRDLLKNFDQVIDLVTQHLGSPLMALSGGSFFDIKNKQPKDLDLVLFYEHSVDVAIKQGVIDHINQFATTNQIDLRLCPYDFNPLWTIKVASFYSHFYLNSKKSNQLLKRGVVLINLS